jgi:hypothetical protein
VRLAYELAIGKRVSDPHWYRTRKLLQQHQLEVTVRNVQLIAQLRLLIPQTALGIDGLLDAYHRADQLVSKSKSTVKGGEVTSLLLQFGITAHQSTISRWFKSLGGYKRSREYKPEQLRDILIRAFLYKAQHDEESTARPNTIQIAS